MGECFVDVTYRGLDAGRRARLRDVAADGAYLEVPMPMPVGTAIDLHTDEGVRLGAIVVRVHEQVGGSAEAPGMRIRPVATDAAARSWWTARAGAEPAPPPVPVPPPIPAPPPPVVVIAPFPADEAAPPPGGNGEVVDDGKRTQVMSTAEIEKITGVADASSSGELDAVDLADASSSGELEAVSGDHELPAGNGNGNGAGNSQADKPPAKTPAKRRRRGKSRR